MLLYKQIDLFRIVPSTGVPRPGWMGWEQPGLLHCTDGASLSPGWVIVGEIQFLLGAPPQVPAHGCPTPAPKALLPWEHIPVFSQRASLILPWIFQTYWFPYPASFPWLLTELLAGNLEQSCCFLRNRAETIYWESITQVPFYPRAHSGHFIGLHISSKAWQQEGFTWHCTALPTFHITPTATNKGMD